MCGIAGYYGFQNEKIVHGMSRDMAHRGPDGEGIYTDKTVTLLNRRLAIIDVQGGNQPIYNEDKSLVVVYNGEIYNYRDLRAQLKKKGHTFTTQSDTEIIVHGYEEWGIAAFDKFNGMFGIALYDIRKKKLMLVRDHFGIKPLYFARIPQQDESDNLQILFSSEIKPLIYSGLIEKKPNDRTIYRYLRYRIHDDEPDTFFHGVQRLMPGHVMTIEDGKTRTVPFTSLQQDLTKAKTKEILSTKDTERFATELENAIALRLISEVPVGTCLSGGLDSSIVVSVANKLLREKAESAQSLGNKQKAYSAVFPGSINDEKKYVDAVVKKAHNLESIQVTPTPEDFFTDLEDFITYQEEPTISTGPYAQYQVMRRASQDVTVLLDGQGADEMMAGYVPYYFVYLRQLWKEGKPFKALQEAWTSRDILGKMLGHKIPYLLRWKKDIGSSTLLAQDFATRYSSVQFAMPQDNLKKRLIHDIFRSSLQSLLRYEDKNAMRFSLEGRVPFLDTNLLRFLFTLPDEAIIQRGWNKWILRDSFRSLLPQLVTNRRNKIGFTTPENEWFLRMKNRIYALFLSESFVNRPYFDQQAVVRAFEDFIKGKNDDTMLFWRILNVEMWLRIFFDEKKEEQKDSKKQRGFFEANEQKKIKIQTEDGKKYLRFPVRTELFQKGDNYADKITQHILSFLDETRKKKSEAQKVAKQTQNMTQKWILIVSEKIVAIAQGRSYFIWDIKPSMWATLLSRYVTRTPYGIGLGSPWTMQLAIQEVGLWRVLVGSILAVVTKPFGVKGVFYHIVGRTVASIDGPTEYSLYPSNVSAKLGPTNPKEAAHSIRRKLRSQLYRQKREKEADACAGVVIIDANDLGRDILGNATTFSDAQIADIMRDNPMGQGSEQTPLMVCVEARS